LFFVFFTNFLQTYSRVSSNADPLSL